MPDFEVLETLYCKANAANVAVCGGGLEVDDNGTRCDHPEKEMRFPQEGRLRYRGWQYDYGYYRFLYRTDFVRDRDLRFPALLRFEDPVFFVKTLTQAEYFYALPKTTYVWRRHDVRWNMQKVNDLIDGLTMVVAFSRENVLEKLQSRQMLRLVTEYKDVILRMLCSDARLTVISRLLRCFAAFDPQCIVSRVRRERLLRHFDVTVCDMLSLLQYENIR